MLAQCAKAESRGKTHPRIDEPELGLGLLLSHTLLLKVLANRLGDSDSTRSGTKEQDPLILERNLRKGESADGSSENDGSGSLDIIVEARVLLAVVEQKGESEGGVEVLELDDLRQCRR